MYLNVSSENLTECDKKTYHDLVEVTVVSVNQLIFFYKSALCFHSCTLQTDQI